MILLERGNDKNMSYDYRFHWLTGGKSRFGDIGLEFIDCSINLCLCKHRVLADYWNGPTLLSRETNFIREFVTPPLPFVTSYITRHNISTRSSPLDPRRPPGFSTLGNATFNFGPVV